MGNEGVKEFHSGGQGRKGKGETKKMDNGLNLKKNDKIIRNGGAASAHMDETRKKADGVLTDLMIYNLVTS